MTSPSGGRGTRFAVAGGILLLILAAVLPTHTIVQWLGTRFNTVAAYPDDFVAGLQTLRVALALNGLLLLAAPWILARCRLVPGGRPGLPGRVGLGAGALYAIAFLLAIPGIAESYQDDEWRVLEQYVRHGPAVILTRATEGDTHPLYSLLAWPFVALFGMGEIPVRIPALFLTPLAPCFLFLLLRRDQPARAAWLAALPSAAAPFLLQYSAEGRAYGPLIAAVLALAFLHPPMLEGKRLAWFAYVATGVAAVFLHLFGAAAVLALWAAPLLRREGRRGETPLRCSAATVAIGALSFLLYAPTLPQYVAYSAAGDGGSPFPNEGPVALAGNLFAPASSPILALPFLAAAGLAVVRRKEPWNPALASAAAAILLAVLLRTVGSQVAHRFFAPAFALAWVPIGAGLASALSRPRLGAVLWAGAVLATAVADVDYRRLGRRDYRAAAREVLARKAPEETLVVRFDGRPLIPYLGNRLPVAGDDELMARSPHWHVGVEENLRVSPKLEAWVRTAYDEAFRLPSIRGTLVGYRRRP